MSEQGIQPAGHHPRADPGRPPGGPSRGLSARRRLLVFLATVLLIAGCGSTGGASPSSTTTGEPATSPSTAASAATSASAVTPPPSSTAASPVAAGWQVVPDQASLRGITLVDIVWTGTRFVAVGTGDSGGAFLDSTDGVTWHRQAALAADAAPASLASRSGRIVAIGTIAGHPASWSSTDGLTWTAAPDAFPVRAAGGDSVGVTDVVEGPVGWLAVGREDPPCDVNCGVSPVRALAWTSRDGLHWDRVPDQPSLEGGGINDIARAEAGYVAAGVASRRLAIWTSTDGSSWSRVPDDPTFHPQSDNDGMAFSAPCGIVAARGAIVIVGTALGVGPGGAPSALAWRSTDGLTWTPATMEDAIPDYGGSVAATTDGLLATGSRWTDDWRRIVWSSIDGRAWATLPSDRAPAGFDPHAVASSPTVEVAVGRTLGQTGSAGAWWRPTT